MAPMILVTGATGTIGRALVKELNGNVRALVRDPDRARALLGPTPQLARGNFDDPASLDEALDGVSAVFLLSAPGPTLAAHDRAIAAAIARFPTVKRIVKLSAMGVDAAERLASSEWHAAGERAVQETGRAFTFLRPGVFMSNTFAWAEAIRAGTSVAIATGHGRSAVIDPRDIAAVAAVALSTDAWRDRALLLTGPELLSAPEQIAIVSEAIGKAIAIEAVTPTVMAERLRAQGAPEVFANAVREGLGYLRAGRAADVSDDVVKVLGRPAGTFARWVADHRDAFLAPT